MQRGIRAVKAAFSAAPKGESAAGGPAFGCPAVVGAVCCAPLPVTQQANPLERVSEWLQFCDPPQPPMADLRV